MTGQVSLSSQDRAAGMGWLLLLLLDKQVPIGNRPEGAHSHQPEQPALIFSCRPPASLLTGHPALQRLPSSLLPYCLYHVSLPLMKAGGSAQSYCQISDGK